MFMLKVSLHDVFFPLISSLYGTVARIYDIVLQVVMNNATEASVSVNDFAQSLYVLFGVFMLFRIIIGLIQMLLNPDLVNDKQVGAGKLLTRIVISIIMLLAFAPNGFIFDEASVDKNGNDVIVTKGILSRIEGAVLSSDGLINNMLNNSEYRLGVNKVDFYSNKNVKEKSCYYVGYNGKEPVVYKISFFSGNPNKNNAQVVENSGGVYYIVRSGYVGGKDSGNELQYSSLGDKKISYGSGLIGKSKTLTCPKSFVASGNNYVTNHGINDNATISGGYTSVNELVSELKVITKAGTEKNQVLLAAKVGLKTAARFMTGLIPADWIATKLKNYVVGQFVDIELLTDLVYRDASLTFSQNIAKSFQECVDSSSETDADTTSGDSCPEAQSRMFGSTMANNDLEKYAENDQLKIDYFTSLIMAIMVIVYLIFLLIEVIIRKFKLILLQVMAPIPIACYVDPKDKTFERWIKMYLSTYVDLFLKLFAINVALILLGSDKFVFKGILVNLLYIIAILIFAKMIPTMISKIFNLDNMGGSFKQIGSMLKSGAGLATGAAIGGAVGAATAGKGFGSKLGGAAKGMLMGAGSGSKGNVMGGAQGVASQNARINEAKANGLNFWQRTAAGIGGSVGYSPKTKMDNQIKNSVDSMEMLDGFRKNKDSTEEMAEKNSYLSDLKTLLGNGVIGKDEYKRKREAYIKAVDLGNLDGFDASYVDLNGQVHDAERKINIKESDAEKVRQAIRNMKASYEANPSIKEELFQELELKHNLEVKKALSIKNESERNAAIKSINEKHEDDKQSISRMETYSDFLVAEGLATSRRNSYETEVIRVKSSKEYAEAEAMENYGKK